MYDCIPSTFSQTYPDDLSSSSLGGKHAEDASATTNVQHCLSLEQVFVVVHGVPVGPCAHLVLQHFLQQKHTPTVCFVLHTGRSRSGR